MKFIIYYVNKNNISFFKTLMTEQLFMANRILDNVFIGSRYAAEDEDFLLSN